MIKALTHENKLAIFVLVAFYNLSGKSSTPYSFKNILKLLSYFVSQPLRLAHLLGLSFTAFCAQDLSANEPVQFKPNTSIYVTPNWNQNLLTTGNKIYLLKNNNLHFTKSLEIDGSDGFIHHLIS